jgi:hypothetical protein
MMSALDGVPVFVVIVPVSRHHIYIINLTGASIVAMLIFGKAPRMKLEHDHFYARLSVLMNPKM